MKTINRNQAIKREIYSKPNIEVIEVEVTNNLMAGSGIPGSGDIDEPTTGGGKRRNFWNEE